MDIKDCVAIVTPILPKSVLPRAVLQGGRVKVVQFPPKMTLPKALGE